MTIENRLEILDIDDSELLKAYFPAIQKLFIDAFGKPISKELWEWAYVENPFGSPKVSLAFDGERLVAHYAVIPMNLSSLETELQGFLSMTTMVASDYRRHQLFQKTAERVYARIERSQKPAVVFGFPNDQSAPGFRKRLGWDILDDFTVVTLTTEDIPKAQDVLNIISARSYFLNLSAKGVADWRCAKPGQEWIFREDISIKSHGQEHDVMYIAPGCTLSGLDDLNSFNMILPISRSQAIDAGWDNAFTYRFGYRQFNMADKLEFNVQMCMSDVF